jgi:hypothetical protein
MIRLIRLRLNLFLSFVPALRIKWGLSDVNKGINEKPPVFNSMDPYCDWTGELTAKQIKK